jgi:ribosomal protein S18 acetylase RimI-like enzyme
MKGVNHLNLRLATLNDVEKIIAYRSETHKLTHDKAEAFDYDAYEARLSNRILNYPNGQQMVITNDNSIGFFGFELREFNNKPCGYIHFIYIEQNYRKKGYGKELLSIAKAMTIGLGLKCLKLRVNQHNKSALDLYMNFGFEIEKKEEKELLMYLSM